MMGTELKTTSWREIMHINDGNVFQQTNNNKRKNYTSLIIKLKKKAQNNEP